MKQQIEPRSDIKSPSIWQSSPTKAKKKLWNFRPRKERGEIAALSPKLKKLEFKGDKYRFGPYVGTLADIREFAATKGLEFVTVGAVKYKTKGAA